VPEARREYDAHGLPYVDVDDAAARSGLLDRYCTEIGRDPASITRSFHARVSYEDPAATRDAVGAAVDAAFTHVVLGLPAPSRRIAVPRGGLIGSSRVRSLGFGR